MTRAGARPRRAASRPPRSSSARWPTWSARRARSRTPTSARSSARCSRRRPASEEDTDPARPAPARLRRGAHRLRAACHRRARRAPGDPRGGTSPPEDRALRLGGPAARRGCPRAHPHPVAQALVRGHGPRSGAERRHRGPRRGDARPRRGARRPPPTDGARPRGSRGAPGRRGHRLPRRTDRLPAGRRPHHPGRGRRPALPAAVPVPPVPEAHPPVPPQPPRVETRHPPGRPGFPRGEGPALGKALRGREVRRGRGGAPGGSPWRRAPTPCAW